MEMEKVMKLAADLEAAKEFEANAKKHRIAIEEAIASLVDVPTEGSKTYTAGMFKVTVKGGINRTADFDAMRKIPGLPSAAYLPIKMVEKLDMDGLEWIEKNAPDIYPKLLECITAKPAKVAVTIKKVEVK